MLYPFRREVEELEPPQLEIKYHPVALNIGQAGVKCRCRDVARAQTVHLILHAELSGQIIHDEDMKRGRAIRGVKYTASAL
jgi:hypothetical protein